MYQNALVIELQTLGFDVEVEQPIAVQYRGEIVGNYVADIVVDGKVILVELFQTSELVVQ